MPPGACRSAVIATSTLGVVSAKAPGQAISKRERRPWSAGGMPMPIITVVVHLSLSGGSQATGRDVPQRRRWGYTALPAARSGNGTSVSRIAVDDLPLRSELSPYVRSVSGRNPAMPGRVGAARLPAPPPAFWGSPRPDGSVLPSPDVHGRVSFGGTVPRTSKGDRK